jgi:hypothetical protein
MYERGTERQFTLMLRAVIGEVEGIIQSTTPRIRAPLAPRPRIKPSFATQSDSPYGTSARI